MRRQVKAAVKAIDRVFDEVDERLPFSVGFRLMPLLRPYTTLKKIRRRVLAKMPGVVQAGRRGIVREVTFAGVPSMEKTFEADEAGRASFEAEILAQELFGRFPWKLPVTVVSERRLSMPRLPDGARLDRYATRLDERARRRVAADALYAALDIHAVGYAHRDFSAVNTYVHEGQLLVSDFETLVAYPIGSRPPFTASYDVTGAGLPSPYLTHNMGYASPSKASLQSALGISSEDALAAVSERLREDLYRVCSSFHTERGRHQLKQPRIYCSFATPAFRVEPQEAQRNAAARLRRFGLSRDDIEGRDVLDLGCNAGAILFEVSNMNPRRGLGIEYDEEKVQVARRIAAFSGLDVLDFRTGDLNEILPGDVEGPFGIVFCLAVEAHVQSPARLYRFLADVTAGKLCFEGNSTTDPLEVARELEAVGFTDVRHLGVCDDDRRPENNKRPLLVATR